MIKEVIGYLNEISWELEVGEADDGVRIYPSVSCYRDYEKHSKARGDGCYPGCYKVKIIQIGDKITPEDKEWNNE